MSSDGRSDNGLTDKRSNSPFKTKQQLRKRDSLNVPRGSFFMHSGGASPGDSSRYRGRVISDPSGVHIGEGRFPEGRITKAVIECQTDRVDGNTSEN